MAFTEAALQALLDPATTTTDLEIRRFIPGPVLTDVYVVGGVAPHAGKALWVQVDSTLTAAQAAAAIVAAAL